MKTSFDFGYLARVTPGYTGAELECIANEAGIAVMEKKKQSIGLDDVRKVMNRLAFHGQEAKNRAKNSRVIAVHEAGHALVAAVLAPDCVYGASILAQGETSGHTNFICSDGEPASVQSEENVVTVLLAGFVAEREILGKIYLGSSNDLERAREKICDLLTRHGAYGYEYLTDLHRYIGPGTVTLPSGIEQKIAEIMQMLDERAAEILNNKRNRLKKIAEALQKKLVLSREELLTLAGKKTKKQAS